MERIDAERWKSREVARLLALVESERRQHNEILAAIPIPLAVLGPDRQFISVNRAFRRMFKVRRKDLPDKSIEQVLPSDRLIEKIRSAHVDETSQPIIERYTERSLRITVLPISGSEDDFESETLLVIEDVTDLTSSQPEPVPVQTSQPRQEPVPRAANVVAERIDALRSLSARMAHDLNNPLMVITGYAEEMMEGLEEGNPLRSSAEQILVAAQRIADVTGQLLEFTRRHAKTPQSVNLTPLLSRVQDKISASFIPAGPMWASADPGQLEEILITLTTGGKDIEITCDAVRDYARITLHDPSRTLDPAEQAGFFESFLIKSDASGFGSAPAHAYAIVREWGGDMSVASGASEGITITIQLPAAKPTSVAPSALESKAPAQRRGAPTVLVVDDEPGIRLLIAKILRGERFNVLEAGSYREALDAASKQKSQIQMLLTDMILPDRNGRELAEQLQKTIPALKVLYMSGFTGEESISSGDLPPDSKFLQKPFTLGTLLSKVRELLGS